jgi:3-oxoacyl-[acyl-carrier-protein] synthase-1
VGAVFGSSTPCSSTKGATGHTLGAAGGVEAAISLLALQHGFLPGGLNLQQPDTALTVNYVTASRSAPLRTVLSNSFGFGGSNASLILGAAR